MSQHSSSIPNQGSSVYMPEEQRWFTNTQQIWFAYVYGCVNLPVSSSIILFIYFILACVHEEKRDSELAPGEPVAITADNYFIVTQSKWQQFTQNRLST